MKNTLKFGPTARLNTAFANLDRSAAVADTEDDVDLDLDEDSNEVDAEDDEDAEDDSESDEDADEDAEDDSESDKDEDDDDTENDDDDSESDDTEDDEDEDDDDTNDADEFDEDEDDDSESDKDTEDEAESDEFEEDVTDFDPNVDDEDEDDASCDDEDDESDADEEEYEVESEDAEAAAIAKLEQAGRCIVIATTDDTAILDSDMEAAIAKLEDDEFEEVIADEDDEDDDTFEEVIAAEDDDDTETDEDDDEDDSESESGDDDEDDDEDEDDSDGDSESDDAEDDDAEDDTEDDEDEDDDDGDAEDGDDAESDASEDDDDSENLAPVATEEFLANASASDVEFHLTDNPTNPILNVIVAGIPAARITLASFGEHASEMASIFRTPRYADSLRKAMASQGVLNLLRNGNAEFYATAYRNTDLFEEAAASAEAVSNERVATAMAGLREDFVDACQLVHAGMDKNFFPNQHPLKRSLYIQLANAGVMNPAAVIETAFAEASASYFDVVANKAVEIMDKSAEAREELRAAIGEAGTIARTPSAAHATTEIPVAQTQASATAAVASTVAIAHELASEQGQHQAVAAVTGSVSERKNAIRSLTGGFKPLGA